MIIPNSVSDAIVEDIRKAAGAWTPDQLAALLRAGRRTRAADYDAIVRGLAQRYVGDQQQIVSQKKQRFSGQQRGGDQHARCSDRRHAEGTERPDVGSRRHGCRRCTHDQTARQAHQRLLQGE